MINILLSILIIISSFDVLSEESFDSAQSVLNSKSSEEYTDLNCANKKPFPVNKKDPSYSELILKTQKAYLNVKGLSAKFTQNSTLLGMTDNFVSSGNLTFLKPGMMNWEYENPKPQKFITNGTKVWFYEPEMNQVTVGELKKSFDSQIPVSFLLGVGNLSQSFEGKHACLTETGIIIELKPKSEQPNLKSFTLLLDKSSFLPIGAKIIDSGDTSTQFLFHDLKLKDNLQLENFEFIIPSGVDVINHYKKD